MLISEVILENFMSYEYARVQLKPGVNIVVGPNGSGKSSFLLGICVALGETYTERSKRLSDLIRWGQREARISLLLDNSVRGGGLRPIPQFDADIIRLTRTLGSDGRYGFELNQKGAQKHEVVEILRRLGFDPDNMLIVMHQGMPESFAILPPQERLRALEEAVGYQSFRADVVEAKRRLGGILSEEASLQQLLDRARETLGYWREQNDRLQEKRRLQTRLGFLQREMAWSRVAELEAALGRLEREAERAAEELRAAEAEMDRHLGLMAEAEGQLQKYRAEWAELLEGRIEYERSAGICDYAIARAREQIVRIEELFDSSSESQRRFRSGTEALRARLKAGPTTLDDYFRLLSEIEEAEAEAHEAWRSGLVAQLAEAKKELGELSGRLGEARAGAERAAGEMERVRDALDKVGDGYVEARVQVALLKDLRGRLQQRIEERGGEIDRCRRDIRSAEAEALVRGPRVETGRSSEEILDELRRASGILLGLADVSDEAEAMYESYSRTYAELTEKAERVRASRRELMGEVEERTRRWLQVTRSLLEEVEGRFQGLLARLGASGEVVLVDERDVEEAGLDLYVGFMGAPPSRLDPYTHSGGERSTVVMAFLLALQQNILSPFRAVDEFDLHMDPRNREAVADFIVSTLEGSADQYLVITPSQVTSRGGNAHIILVHKTEGLSALSVVSQDAGEGSQGAA